MAGRGSRERGRCSWSAQPILSLDLHPAPKTRRHAASDTLWRFPCTRAAGNGPRCAFLSSSHTYVSARLHTLSLAFSSSRLGARLTRLAMPSTYDPLGQHPPDDDVDFPGQSSSRPPTAYPPKPETYYGDGPFDPPSSDDESDVLLEKGGPRTPGIIEEEGDLVVGRSSSRKVCSPIPYSPHSSPI